MLTIGDKLPAFDIIGVKPGFTQAQQDGISAFERLTHESFAGFWKIFYFYPKDFSFICPKEIQQFDDLHAEFGERSAVVIGGNTDNEHSKLAWRRIEGGIGNIQHWQFADAARQLIDALGVFDFTAGTTLRATFIVNPYNIIQHVHVNPVHVGRKPIDTLKILDGLLGAS